MHMLCSREIEITEVFNTFGAVAVRMDSDEVFYLFEHPMVDYIDFPMEFRLGWDPLRSEERRVGKECRSRRSAAGGRRRRAPGPEGRARGSTRAERSGGAT